MFVEIYTAKSAGIQEKIRRYLPQFMAPMLDIDYKAVDSGGFEPAMDIEFHYYMTYLIAVRAGFHPAEATTLAQAAQEIDDNHIPISVSKGTPAEYESVISQTMDILRPKHNERI